MVKYEFEGDLVDLKGDNIHDSALVEEKVKAGEFVRRGVAVEKVKVATSGASDCLGVAIFERASGDDRPLTYTRFGNVNLIAGATVARDDWLEVQNNLGEVGPFAGTVAFSGSSLTVNDLRKIVGRANESGASGAILRCHIGGLVL